MSIEKKVARNLLEIEAVKLSPDEPFIWASGWKSPIYCDNRRILSFPKIRKEVCQYIIDIIKENFHDVEVIAGVATGAIAYGAIVADMMGLPFIYVRSLPKDHGMGNQVEGVVNEGMKVVVIEDLISTGKSSLDSCIALSKAGAMIEGMVAIFSYNFTKSRRAFEKANIELHTLSNYDALIDEALSTGYIEDKDVELLKQWRLAPDMWGR